MSDYTTLSSENAVSSTFPLSPILVDVCIQSSNFLLSLRVSTLTLLWLFQYNFILSKVVTKRLPLTLNKLFKMHVWPCPLCYIKTSLVSSFYYYKYHNPEHAISLVQSLISTSCLKLLISLQFIIHSSIIVILTFFLQKFLCKQGLSGCLIHIEIVLIFSEGKKGPNKAVPPPFNFTFWLPQYKTV